MLGVAAALFLCVDHPLARWVATLDPAWIAPFEAITGLGDSRNSLVPIAGVLLIVLAAHYGLRQGRAAETMAWLAGALVFLFAAIALSGILCNVIKVIVGRARPGVGHEVGDFGFAPFSFGYDHNSFPSGHANTVFALALALGYLVPRLRPVLVILAGGVALSRVAIGVHFLSDVAGGGAVAVATTRMLRDALAARGWVFTTDTAGAVALRRPGLRLLCWMRCRISGLGALRRIRWRRAMPAAGSNKAIAEHCAES